MIAAALMYASRGWPIFPLTGKVPRTRNGFKEATTDPRTIQEWWHRWPDANIGYAIQPDQFVLDIDPRHNGDRQLDHLQQRHGPLPDTRRSYSGRCDGGHHLYFTRPAGKLTDRKLGEGIDIRVGGNHYVVVPPSVHPDTEKRYRWAAAEMPILTPPAWLVDLIRDDIRRPEPPPLRRLGGCGSHLVDFVADLQEGNRNHGFFWAVCTAISDGVYPAIQADLKAAARSVGLSDHEIEATAGSAERRQS